MAELKPCPFCGGKGYIVYFDFLSAEVICSECGARGTACCGNDSDERAIEAWNRRAEDGK